MKSISLFSAVLLASVGVAFAAPAAKQANPLEGITLRGTTDRDKAFFEPGEIMTFSLRVDTSKAKHPLDEGYCIAWTRKGDDGKTEQGKGSVGEKPLVIKTSLDRPGFVWISAHLVDAKGKVYQAEPVSFNGGAGVHPEKLRSIAEPKDFDAFWKARKAKLATVPFTDTKRVRIPCKNSKVEIYAVSIPCAGPRPVTGYLTIPVKAKTSPLPALLSTEGHGTRPPHEPKNGRLDCIELHINAHGFDLGKDEKYYKAFFASIASNGRGYAFDPKQNADRETAYFSGMSFRVMRGLQYLKSLPEWNKKDLWAAGGSQGGLQTVWAAGLDPAVTKATANVPWCCDLARSTEGRVMGNWGIAYSPALNYYDPVFIGKRVSKTCSFSIPRAGLGDYVCPPSGIAILYNILPCPKKIHWVQESTHGYVPPAPYQSFDIEEK